MCVLITACGPWDMLCLALDPGSSFLLCSGDIRVVGGNWPWWEYLYAIKISKCYKSRFLLCVFSSLLGAGCQTFITLPSSLCNWGAYELTWSQIRFGGEGLDKFLGFWEQSQGFCILYPWAVMYASYLTFIDHSPWTVLNIKDTARALRSDK